MNKPRVLIVSPALANANNGNWQTAWRWSRMLSPAFDATIAQVWNGEPYDVMLALHARRSAGSIAAWAKAQGSPANASGLAVVLTGTDLYGDIHTDTQAQASLRLAQQLVVLQECGPDALPDAMRAKSRVIFQSASTRKMLQKPRQHLRALMVGHLRDVKSPQTLFSAARLLADHPDILIDHIGEPLNAALGVNGALLVDSLEGLRHAADMQAANDADGDVDVAHDPHDNARRPTFAQGRWRDAAGRIWQEISLAELAGQDQFLAIAG